MDDPVTWLDVLILLGVYLLGATAWQVWLTWRERRAVETGGEAAPDPQDEGSVATSRAGCTPAASPPASGLMHVPETADKALILCTRWGCDQFAEWVGSAHQHTKRRDS